MYFWVPNIACPKLTPLYINYTTNGFVPVVRKSLLDIMLPERRINQSSLLSIEIIDPTYSLRKSILVESLVHFQAYILAL